MERYALLLAASALTLLSPDGAIAQTEAVLTPIRDNTLFESTSGNLSNGVGQHLFAGTTNGGDIRRALVAFDLTDIPEGVRVDSVTLTLHLSRSVLAGDGNFALHRVTSDWGEGPSEGSGEEGGGGPAQSGDATWIHTFYDTETWEAAGGDFVGSPSATMEIGGVGSYTWTSTDELVTDVQSWIDDPSTNFGWILLGDESAARTAKRFDSREHATAANRPTLRVYYATGTAVDEELPLRPFLLGDNYPDPARSSTMIPLDLNTADRIVLEVYDLLGRSRSIALDEVLAPGRHQIEIRTDDFPNGAYFYCAMSTSGRSCRTMVVAR